MEEREDRAAHLANIVDGYKTDGVKAHVAPGEFDDHMNSILDYIDEQEKRLAPAYVRLY